MSELKKKIKNKLDEVTATDIGNTLDKMKDEVGRELPNLPPEEVEDVVASSINVKDELGDGEIYEVNDSAMDSFTDQYGKERGEEIYYATANKQDRDPETFELDEIGDDYEQSSREIEHGISPEAGIDYSELDNLINQVNATDDSEEKGGLKITKIKRPKSDDTNELPFEGVRPSMTKDELLESVLSKKQPKVIKRIKVKDIKNGK